MRFAAGFVCLCLAVAGSPAIPESMSDATISSGIHASSEGLVPLGVAQVSVHAPIGDGADMHGAFDLSAPAHGGPAAIGIGAGLSVDAAPWSLYADLRYGISVGDLSAETGIDLMARAGPNLTLGAGPHLFARAAHASGDLDAAATASHDGFIIAGLRLSASYDLGDNWGLDGRLRIDRPLTSDTGDDWRNPPSRLSATIMATHRFQLEF